MSRAFWTYQAPKIFIHSLTLLLGASLSTTTFSGCSSDKPKEQIVINSEPIKLTVVHNQLIKPLVDEVRNKVIEPSAGNAPIILQSVILSESAAADRLASGEVKADGWLPAGQSWVNLANSQVRNLGATQGECKSLFSSPLLFAVHGDDAGKLPQDADGKLLWSALLKNDNGKTETSSLAVRLLYPEIKDSAVGLGSSVLLTALSLGVSPNELTSESLQDEKFQEALSAIQRHTTRYPEEPSLIVETIAKRPPTRVFVGVTTEQAVRNYTATRGEVPVQTLAPSLEISQQYLFCQTQVDWYSREQQQALARLSAAFSETAATYGQANGYRVPDEKQVSLSSDTTRALQRVWEGSRVPIRTVLSFDRSGSLEGERFASVRDSVASFASFLQEKDQAALIDFSSTAKIAQGFTSDSKAIRSAFSALEPQGSSAVFEALKLSYQLHGQDASLSSATTRRAIVLITDGVDNDGSVTDEVLRNVVRSSQAHQDITLIAVFVKITEDEPEEKLVNLLEEFGATIYRTSPLELTETLVRVHENL